jgi:hypothetical protein
MQNATYEMPLSKAAAIQTCENHMVAVRRGNVHGKQATNKLATDNTQRAMLQHKARSTTLQHAPGNVQHARHTTCKAPSMLHAGPSVATLIQQMMQKTVQHNMQANRQRCRQST